MSFKNIILCYIQRLERMTKQLTQKPEDAEAGAFIGFDSSNESDLSQDEVGNEIIDSSVEDLYEYKMHAFFAGWKHFISR